MAVTHVLVLRQIFVADRPPGGAVEVVELAVMQRP
jgi:hypothetical protein